MHPFKIFAIDSGTSTDFAFELQDGRIIFVHKFLQQINSKWNEKVYRFMRSDRKRELNEGSEEYQEAIKKYKALMREFSFPVDEEGPSLYGAVVSKN